jgi:protein disulfide-isomerase-like protein
MKKPLILLTLLSTTFLLAIATVQEIVIGTPHSQVITLTEENYESMITDPANGLWLLKFYAPWCGHCQKLAPVLDAIAQYLKGKMAIGKIDCTTERRLCSKFNVEGYPTLKIYRDGDYMDYPGKRDADSMIIFGEKMSSYSVHMASSYSEIIESIVPKSDVGVVFVAYDSQAKVEQTWAPVEQYIQSTANLQIFGQVARKMQAYADFVLLHPSTAQEQRTMFGHGSQQNFFIAQVQVDADPVLLPETTTWTTSNLLEFVKTHNMPLITQLDEYNFRTTSRKGKVLAMAVVNPEDVQVSHAFMTQWKRYAKTAPEAIRNQYIFSSIDGKKWSRFLEPFSIETTILPQILLLDVPNRKYWFEKSMPMEKFMMDVHDGNIPFRIQTRSESKWIGKMEEWMWTYSPYSFILAFVCFTGIVYLLTMSCFEYKDDPGTDHVMKKKQS